MSFYPRRGRCHGYVPTEAGVFVVYVVGVGSDDPERGLDYVLVAESADEVAVRPFDRPSTLGFQELDLQRACVEIALPRPLGDRPLCDGGASFRPLLPRWEGDLPGPYIDWTQAPTEDITPLAGETHRWRVRNPAPA